jgi:putative ABC transport system permease protein
MPNEVSPQFWIRWSLRDLRARSAALVAIAVVIATRDRRPCRSVEPVTWLRLSNDASSAAGNLHDLPVTTAPGTFLDQGTLRGLVASISSSAAVDTVAER